VCTAPSHRSGKADRQRWRQAADRCDRRLRRLRCGGRTERTQTAIHDGVSLAGGLAGAGYGARFGADLGSAGGPVGSVVDGILGGGVVGSGIGIGEGIVYGIGDLL
jgi:hypothetical protein